MAWPTDTVNTANLDATTDDPSQARSDLKNFGDLISSIITNAVTAATADTVALRDTNGDLAARRLISNMATGTSPLSVTSTTKVTNLNADTVDGQHLSTTDSPTFVTVTAALSGNSTTSTTATGVDDAGAGSTDLKVKIVNIGNWDMDANASVTVALGLTVSSIRVWSVMIIEDISITGYPIDYQDPTSGVDSGAVSFSSNNANLSRELGGFFDAPTFDNSIINRGYITIWYV